MKDKLVVMHILPTNKIIQVKGICEDNGNYYIRTTDGTGLVISYSNAIIYDFSKFSGEKGVVNFLEAYETKIHSIINNMISGRSLNYPPISVEEMFRKIKTKERLDLIIREDLIRDVLIEDKVKPDGDKEEVMNLLVNIVEEVMGA